MEPGRQTYEAARCTQDSRDRRSSSVLSQYAGAHWLNCWGGATSAKGGLPWRPGSSGGIGVVTPL